MNLTTAKTKQFCETSSIFKVDNIKNETILRDFLQKWKVECRADGLVPMRFAIFPLHLSKVLCLPRKMHLCRSSSNVPRLPSFSEMLQNPHVLRTFDKVHNPLRLPRETTSERPKVVRTCSAFNVLTSKRASRHNGVHFFDISTAKSGANMWRFVHFDFEMCFAPQRRALFFQHRNFEKCSEREVLLAFSLANVLCATTACNFSSLICPAGSVPAALASLLFDPPEPQIEKHSESRLSYLFALLNLLSSHSFSCLIFCLLLFSSLTLPISAFHLYCRKFDF